MLAVVVAGGCGGSGGGSGKRLSPTDYAAKADALCIKYHEKTKSIGRARNLKEVADAFDRALPILDKALTDIRRLKPPANEQPAVNRWLAQSEVLKGDLTKMRDRARANDLKGVRATFTRAVSDARRANQSAAWLGMKVCSKG